MRVLVGQSYFRILDRKEYSRAMPYPPLGTLICVSMVKNAGHEVEFFDAMLGTPDEFIVKYTKDSYDAVIFYDDEFNYLTKMSLSRMRETVLSLASNISSPVILYSSDGIYHPEEYLKGGVDYVITGEGEYAVLELLEFLEGNRSIEGIRGIAYLERGEIRQTPSRPLHSRLDDFPDPAYELVDLQKYRLIWLEKHGYFSINITTSRGCTYKCNWCSKPLWGRTYNVHSASRIASLMRMLSEKWGVDHFWITDDIFGMKKGWLEEFLNALGDFRPRYKCLSRADLLIKGRTVELLKATGCQTIWIGAESGSQQILDRMEKGIKVEDIYRAVELCRNHNIEICFFIQFGYMGENWEDIEATRQLIRETLPDDIGISVSYPLPGTKFYEMVKNKLGRKRHWVDSDDLDPLFPGTYPREFYKKLHRLVHNEYRYYKYRNSKKPRDLLKTFYHFVMMKGYEKKVKPYRKTRYLTIFAQPS